MRAGETSFLQPYSDALTQLDPHLAQLRRLYADQPSQMADLERDVLRFAEKLLRALHAPLDLLERGMRQTGEVARLVIFPRKSGRG